MPLSCCAPSARGRRHSRRNCSVPYAILDCQAPPEVLRQRLRSRTGDASEADVDVLDKLQAIAQPLDQSELALVKAAR